MAGRRDGRGCPRVLSPILVHVLASCARERKIVATRGGRRLALYQALGGSPRQGPRGSVRNSSSQDSDAPARYRRRGAPRCLGLVASNQGGTEMPLIDCPEFRVWIADVFAGLVRSHGRIRDTRDEPAESGYRAVHVIVVRDGRRIEIQLRMPREHEWAVAVERTGIRLGIGLKEGEGPDDLKEYFRLAGQGLSSSALSRTQRRRSALTRRWSRSIETRAIWRSC